MWERLSNAPRNAVVRMRRPAERRRFRRRLLDFHRAVIRPGDLVFDVGANVGDYTAAYLGLEARVVAIEPGEEALAVLRRRFDGDERVVIVPAGASDSEGALELYVSTEGGSPLSTVSRDWIQASKESGRFSHFSWRPAGQIEVTTLDALIDRFGVPAFAKIDVEGSELQVVRGLSRAIAAMSLEFHHEYRDHALEALLHLSSLGATEFMYVTGESLPAIGKSMPGAPGKWCGLDEIRDRLGASVEGEWGDLLVRAERR